MGGIAAIHDLVTSPEIRKGASDFVSKTFVSMKEEFQKSEAGKSLWNLVQEHYLPTLDKAATQLGQKSLGKNFGSNAVGVQTSQDIWSKARNIASEQAFGKNHELIAAHLAAATQEVGDTNAPHVKNLADNMAMILHDNDVKPEFKGKKVVAYNPVSAVKYNALRDKQYGPWLTKFIDAKQVYTNKGPGERAVYTFAHTTLAPFAALGHLGTFTNAAFSTPFKSLNSSLIDMLKDYQGTKETLRSSGVLQEDVLNTIKQRIDYRQGKLAQYVPGSVADYINRAIHMPGLRGVRNLQITMFGSAGYHTAIDMAARLAKDPSDRRAIFELNDMHIDTQQVLKQKGELNPDQIQAGIWHYVNNHVFLHTDTERAFNSQQNMWTRQASMFHSFTSAQGRFIRHEMQKAYTLKGSDPLLFARSLSALLVAFPTMGFAIKQIEQVGRGESPDPMSDIHNIDGQNGGKAVLEEYLDDFSYVAGFGIAGSYVRGASRNALGNMLLGPVGNAVARTAVVDPYRFYKSGDIKPEARDLITYAFPDNIGKVITHKVLPTRTDKSKGKMHSLRMKGMKGLSMN